jgi:hypothetical protein
MERSAAAARRLVAALDQRTPVESRDHAARRFRRTLHVRHEIVHDAGRSVQLPIAELFQDDRAQQFVVGRGHRNGGRGAQPRGEIRQRDPPVGRQRLCDQQQMAAVLAREIVEMEQGALGRTLGIVDRNPW